MKSLLIFSHCELIGDGMMKLPFINALYDAFPETEVTWFAGRHPTIFATALAPIVDGKIHHVVNHSKLGDSLVDVMYTKWRTVLPHHAYDVILDTEHKLLPTLMLKSIPHKRFISASMKWLLSDQKPKSSYIRPILLMNRLMDLLSVAAQRTIEPVFGVDVPLSYMENARGLLPEGRTVLLAPGAGGRFKCWPLQNFIDLGNRLITDGFNVAHILGPAETEWYDALHAGVRGHFFLCSKQLKNRFI